MDETTVGLQSSGVKRLGQLLIVALLPCTFAACSDSDTPDATGQAAADRTDPEMMERRRELLQRKFPDELPEKTPQPAMAITGEVPQQVLDSAVQALEKLTGASRSDFATLRSEEVVWPDGALGCAQPGMTYTHAPVPGYHIVLRHNGRDYDYRAGGTSFLMLCLEPSGQIPSGTAPPSR